MNISNTTKGLFIGGLIFVGIFFSIVVVSKQARAQAQVEEAQAKAHQVEALRAQADEARAHAEELRARAEMSKKQMKIRENQLSRVISQLGGSRLCLGTLTYHTVPTYLRPTRERSLQ